MDNRLPSSDDESEEMESMLDKLQSIRNGKRRKSWIDASDDASDDEDPFDTGLPTSKKAKADNHDVESDTSSISLESLQRLSDNDSESVHGRDRPPTTHVHVASAISRPNTPSSLHASQSSTDPFPSPSQQESPDSGARGGGRNDDGSENDSFDKLDLDCLDDATLEAALKRAEAEYLGKSSSVANDMDDSAEPLTLAECMSQSMDPTPSQGETPTPPPHASETTKPSLFGNNEVDSQQIRQADEHEEEWIEAYLEQEKSQEKNDHHEKDDDDQSIDLQLQDSPPERSELSRQDTAKTPQDSFVLTQITDKIHRGSSPDAFATSPVDEHQGREKSASEDDDSVQELLRQQERLAKGEDPFPLLEPLPTVPAVSNFTPDQFFQAFGVSDDHSTQAAGTVDSPLSSASHELGNESLEIPTRDGVHCINDGIERDERYGEVDPSRYPLPPRGDRPEPLVHCFTKESHPPNIRKRTNVSGVFDNPQVAKFFRQKFENFNPMQSELANLIAYSDDHMVVSAPTGAGKTAVFEMAMARFFTADLSSHSASDRPRGQKRYEVSNRRKIVYISPSKALIEERYEDWTHRLAQTKLGVEVATVTGDGDPSESFRDVASASVILTTPEKWDSLTRRWTENFVLLASVKLVLIDEIHLLADQSRGPCLESIINRLKSIQHVAENARVSSQDIMSSSFMHTSPEAIASPMRIVAVSATLPNISEVAEFLTANEAFVFDESFRPVPLTTHVVGLGNVKKSEWHFWKGLDREVPSLIRRFSDGRQTLVFCHSKAETEQLADTLANFPGIGKQGQKDVASRASRAKLQRVLYCGIGYHHAGMEPDERHLVEQAFASCQIRVLLTTTTLAQGVNLPARLVIVKGTKAWRGTSNGYQDLDQATLLQMIGRAGRPGYDSSGTAVIMTENRTKEKFKTLATTGLAPAQSQLLQTFEESLAPEISQGVITDMNSALNWIKGTLLYVQVKRNPSAYSIRVVSPHSIDTHLLGILREAIRKLRKIGVVVLGEGSAINPHDGCHIMSQHMVDYSTMKILSEIPFDATQRSVLQAVCQIERLQRPVKRNEKKILNALQKQVLHNLEGPPSKVRVKDPWEKAFVLIQASVGRLTLEDYTLQSETKSMCEFASRMLLAAEEVGARATKNGQIVVQSLKLRRAIATSLWSYRDGVLGQFESLSDATVFALKNHGVNSFDDVLDKSENFLEKAARREQPFGLELKNAVQKVLSGALKINATIKYAEDGSGTPQRVQCHLQTKSEDHQLPSCPGETTDISYTLVAYTDRPNGCLLYKRGVTRSETVEFKLPPRYGKVTIHLIASMVGLDDTQELSGNSEVYRTVEPSSQIAKAKKKNSSETVAANNPVTNLVSEPARPNRQIRVTPSPKPNPSAKKQLAARTEVRRRDSSITDFLKTRAEAQSQQISQEQRSSLDTTTRRSAQRKCSESDSIVLENRESIARPIAFSGIAAFGGVQAKRSRATTAGPTPGPSVGSRRMQPTATWQLQQPRRQNPAPRVDSSNVEVQEQIAPGMFATSMAENSSFRSPSTTTTWKKTRKVVQRSQKRVFPQKDNLFSSYQHDPNDSESVLDLLSQRATPPSDSHRSTIIPMEGQRALNRAYQKSFQRTARTPGMGNTAAGRRQGSHTNQRQQHQTFSRPVVEETSLLAQKAFEQEMYASPPTHTVQISPYSGRFSRAHSQFRLQRREADQYSLQFHDNESVTAYYSEEPELPSDAAFHQSHNHTVDFVPEESHFFSEISSGHPVQRPSAYDERGEDPSLSHSLSRGWLAQEDDAFERRSGQSTEYQPFSRHFPQSNDVVFLSPDDESKPRSRRVSAEEMSQFEDAFF